MAAAAPMATAEPMAAAEPMTTADLVGQGRRGAHAWSAEKACGGVGGCGQPAKPASARPWLPHQRCPPPPLHPSPLLAPTPAGMSIFNKLAVVHLPLPLTIVAIQMAFTVLALLLLQRSALSFGSRRDVARWGLSVPLLFVGMLATSMLAIQYASLGTIVVCRNVAPLFTLAIERCFRAPFVSSAHTLASLCVIVTGVTLYELTEVSFSLAGMAAIAANMAFAVLERIMQRHLMANEPVRLRLSPQLSTLACGPHLPCCCCCSRRVPRAPNGALLPSPPRLPAAEAAPARRSSAADAANQARHARPSPLSLAATRHRRHRRPQVELSKQMMMLLNNGIGAGPCLLLAAAMGEHESWQGALRGLSSRGFAFLVLSCVNGLAISYAGIRLQHLVAATSFMVITNVNKFAVIFFGIAAFNEAVCAHPMATPRPNAVACAPARRCSLSLHAARLPLPAAPPHRQASPLSMLGCLLAICGGVYYAEARKRVDAAAAQYVKLPSAAVTVPVSPGHASARQRSSAAAEPAARWSRGSARVGAATGVGAS